MVTDTSLLACRDEMVERSNITKTISKVAYLFIWGFIFYLFGVLRRFQHCTGHITTGSLEGQSI